MVIEIDIESITTTYECKNQINVNNSQWIITSRITFHIWPNDKLNPIAFSKWS
jgi:hypothetical protein